MDLLDQKSRNPKTCINDLVGQKIKSLNALAKFLEKILDMFKKHFLYLGLW